MFWGNNPIPLGYIKIKKLINYSSVSSSMAQLKYYLASTIPWSFGNVSLWATRQE